MRSDTSYSPAETEPPLERLTYTIEEAAKILGICRALAYRPGVLPTIKIAGRRLVPKRALEEMLGHPAEPSAKG